MDEIVESDDQWDYRWQGALGKASRMSKRKLILIGLACYGYPRALPHDHLVQLAETVAAYAEGQADQDTVRRVLDFVKDTPRADTPSDYYLELRLLGRLAWHARPHAAVEQMLREGHQVRRSFARCPSWCNVSFWCQQIQEVAGNTAHSSLFCAEWRTSDVLLLAQGIYDERAFDGMPILADALQDAGCDNTDILAHLRDENATHVRGCWALDLVLGKE